MKVRSLGPMVVAEDHDLERALEATLSRAEARNSPSNIKPLSPAFENNKPGSDANKNASEQKETFRAFQILKLLKDKEQKSKDQKKAASKRRLINKYLQLDIFELTQSTKGIDFDESA